MTEASKDVLNRKIFFSVGARKVRGRSLTLSTFSDLNLNHLSREGGGRE